MDESFLDNKYFIDRYIYNCPFCNRRHVSYRIRNTAQFDWTGAKKCFIYIAECDSCRKESMHLSFTDLKVGPISPNYREGFRFEKNQEFDDLFFYSVPTSFFVLDKRIPKILRELITEAEECLKSNLLTGASSCTRKVIYELAVIQGATGENYEDRIKSLKAIRTDVEPTFFDTLLTIQQVTSSKVHEQSYDGWESKHLRLILSTLTKILHEIFVVPAVREDDRKAILKLKGEVLGGKGEEESPIQSNEKKSD